PAAGGPAEGAPVLRGAFAVQVGAFAVEANARRLAARLGATFRAVRVVEFQDNRATWWRVRVGGYGDEEEAASAAAAFAEQDLAGFVVRED
ncbi:MAG TPA: SPOR domain-containing protein, partial [bacterium]